MGRPEVPAERGYLPGWMRRSECWRRRTPGVEEVSIYGFTKENVRRPSDQRHEFQKACVEAVRRLERMNAELRAIGDSFSHVLRGTVDTERTVFGSAGRRSTFINYSWKWDVAYGDGHSVSRCVPDRPHHPLGRTIRLSGFLPIQSVYADIYVLDRLWPDGSGEDVYEALEWYQEQDPTRGG